MCQNCIICCDFCIFVCKQSDFDTIYYINTGTKKSSGGSSSYSGGSSSYDDDYDDDDLYGSGIDEFDLDNLDISDGNPYD